MATRYVIHLRVRATSDWRKAGECTNLDAEKQIVALMEDMTDGAEAMALAPGDLPLKVHQPGFRWAKRDGKIVSVR